MKRSPFPMVLAVATIGLFSAADWPQFRGPNSGSFSPEQDLPIRFVADQRGTDGNVAWKVPLPGRGPSSPIVVQGRVIVTASSGVREDRLHVLCFDSATGNRLWQRQLWATGHTAVHGFGANAAPTPASDGRHVFAFFSSNDLACFDLQGNLLWFRGLAHDYPAVRNDVGMASSPIVAGGTLIVQLDTPAASFVAGLDKETGQTQWRIERDKGAIWSSPVLLRGDSAGQDAVILQSRERLTAHNPGTGELLWEFEASCHSIASAATDGSRVYLPAHGLHALQYNAQKREVELVWHQKQLSSGNASPIIHNGRAYTVKSNAVLTCGDAATGDVLWQVRLQGPQWSSPVIAGGRLYCVNHKGLVQVVELGEKGKLVGTSQIDTAILASPAVADGAIYFRSDQQLWKIASE